MYERLLELPLDASYFLFGPRGTGKSTLLKNSIASNRALWYDLLLPEEVDRLAKDPSLLIKEVLATSAEITHIVVDEIQKIPALLDVVHHLIESTDKHFVLTGSSARKLKIEGANLLAGRAFVFDLFPFSCLEVGDDFVLDEALEFGCLPKALAAKTRITKRRFLQSYALTYLREEIQGEQVVRQLDPFRKFLQVCAQCSGKVINYASIARDVGVDDKTVKNYFSITEDTLIGFYLETYHSSPRKRLNQKPKFYLFDTGVQRALAGLLTVPVLEGTSAYGELFEAFIIAECKKLSRYAENDYTFTYLSTRDDVEIDLVVERPGKSLLLVEIKSSKNITSEHLKGLRLLAPDFPEAERICIARVERAQIHDGIRVLPWREALREYFYTPPL